VTTARTIIEGSLKHLDRFNAGETSANEDADFCLEVLNDMMFGWAGKGVDVSHYEMELETPFPLDDKHIRGCKALLAVEIANAYGMEPPNYLQKLANDGWLSLYADYATPGEATFDAALTSLPSNRYLS
jgi:hypothetical protein